MPLIAAIPFSGCNRNDSSKDENRMNIVYIMTDDHAFQAISAYGSPLSQLAPTPNLDRLAAEGIIFNRAYVAILR